MMRMLLFGTLILGLLVSPARGDPFFLRYDADNFPEKAGWERYTYDPEGGLIRTVEDGIFTIDSRRSAYTADFYHRHVPAIELNLGEELRLEWRMRTLETDTTWKRTDVVVGIGNLEEEFVEIYLAPDYVAVNEDGIEWPEHVYEFGQDQWHTFLFTSTDMQEFDLFVDGDFAFHGQFTRHWLLGPNRVSFGDVVTGRTSLSEWDYVQVSVLPEAASGTLALASLAMAFAAVRRTK